MRELSSPNHKIVNGQLYRRSDSNQMENPALAQVVQPTNLTNYAVTIIGVLVVSTFAAFLPARRAMKIDPLTACRYE